MQGKEFASRLQAVRLAWGAVTGRPALTRKQFAEELGLQGEAYRRYERGDAEPNLSTLKALRQLTGISLDFLIADEEQPGFRNPRRMQSVCQASFAERLKWARETQAETTREVAKVMGVSVATYESWENGRAPMPEGKMQEFAHRFSVSMGYLRRGTPVGVAPPVLAALRERHPDLWKIERSRTAKAAGSKTRAGSTASARRSSGLRS